MIKKRMVFLLLLSSATVSAHQAFAESVLPKEVRVEFTQSHPRYETKTRQFVWDGVLHNTLVTAVAAPVALVMGAVTPKSSSLALLKPDGHVADGGSYRLVLKSGNLLPGAKQPFSLRFSYNNPISQLVLSALEDALHKTRQYKPPTLANFQFQQRIVQLPAHNRIPVAHAGIDKVVTVGNHLKLDGSRSFDPNKDKLHYHWQLSLAPGSKASLSKPLEVITEFVPDIAGIYKANLIVDDSYVQSLVDTAKITVKPGNSSNHNPVITSYAPNSATATVSFSYEVTATDADKDKLIYALDVSPPGMTISELGVINWSVPNKPHARVAVAVKVSDGKGGVARQSFSIHIQPCICR